MSDMRDLRSLVPVDEARIQNRTFVGNYPWLDRGCSALLYRVVGLPALRSAILLGRVPKPVSNHQLTSDHGVTICSLRLSFD